jgi:uncharacterized protein YecE (DUF72 family)
VIVRPPDERTRDDGFIRFLLDSLDPSLRVAFDLRHASWDGVEPLLAEAGAVRVNSLEAEAGFRYLRLREPPYDDEALTAWAARLRVFVEEGVDVYCYFMHEDDPRGALYAERLLTLAAA